MRSISGAWLHLLDFLGDDKTQEQLRTHSTIKMTLQFERKYSTQGSGAPCHVSLGFFSGFYGIILAELRLTLSLNLRFDLRLGGYIPYAMRFFESHFPYGFFFKTRRVLLKTFKRRTRGRLGTTREDFKTTQGSGGVPSSLRMLRVFLRTFGL
jgi:hypothetical protein